MMFRKLIPALMLLPALAFAEQEDVKTISAGTVEIIDFDFTPAASPLVGNKTIIEVQPGANPRQLKVVGMKKGTTSLIISTADGKLARKLIYNVVGNDRSADLASIRKLLHSVEGITVESDGDKIVIDGELLTPADRARVMRVIAGYPDVLDLTTMSKMAR